MNIIKKHPIGDIGYNFIEKKYLPKGKNEYHLRENQNKNSDYKELTSAQIDILRNNNNQSDNWKNVLVKKSFNPALVKNCTFSGLIRIGNLDAICHEFHDFKMAVGIYNSNIISCDLGNNVCIDNVKYLSHYIIENDVMLVNINELATTSKAKFGNGILKDGETDESQRMIIEVCNENGGRYIIPFNNMLPGDAYMWSKYRDEDALLDKFKTFTENTIDKQRGYYGIVGARTVIKNCALIKDTHIGSDAYIKGANKLKNLTINSDADRKTQIGEGCELVNGIIGFGCRIFYGVKAVRFIVASHSQLKYGARLINSYLGNNSTISCCEVLNSLIFSAHEQHHNNSFLCASLLMGQSNIPAGATIGSNHNSRSADGEIIAGRGFWPGLCTSLKHNSIFSSFTIIAKGDYPHELNIPIPFSLISNDVANDSLVVMPAYWFMYNMYALARNAWKYETRDKRTEKIQKIEYDYLAPDTINEIFESLLLLEKLNVDEKGESIIHGWENSRRNSIITKIPQSIALFKKIIQVYAGTQLLTYINTNKITNFESFKKLLLFKKRSKWINIGGQLIKESEINQLKKNIVSGKIKSWDQVHQFYAIQGAAYEKDKAQHALASILELWKIPASAFNASAFKNLLTEMLETKAMLTKQVQDTRAKDYTNAFRKMAYANDEEMNKVLGKIEENEFIKEEIKRFNTLKRNTKELIKKWKL